MQLSLNREARVNTRKCHLNAARGYLAIPAFQACNYSCNCIASLTIVTFAQINGRYTGLVIRPHQSVRVELYDSNNDFTIRARLLRRVYVRESALRYVRMHATTPIRPISSGTIARENIA